MSVKFGFMHRGSMPYIFNYQNVLLKKVDPNQPSKALFHCTVNSEKLVIPKGSVSISREEEKTVYLEFSSNEPNLNFVCSIDQNSYIQTYTVNGNVLFQCRYDPTDLVIHYSNMKETTTQWTFCDH